LTAGIPGKDAEEIEAILAGVWDNLGRVGAEFAHMDHIWDHDEAHPDAGRTELSRRTHELFHQLRLDGKPALIFASHLANWEMPALAAVAHGLDCAILYRRPNIASADRIIQEMRQVKMGTLIPAGRDAPLRLAEACRKAARRDAGRPVSDPAASRSPSSAARPGQSDAGAPPPSGRMPSPWRAHHPPARPPLPGRTDRGSEACARRARQDRRPGHHAGDHLGGRKAGSANIRINGCGCIGDGGRAVSEFIIFTLLP